MDELPVFLIILFSLAALVGLSAFFSACEMAFSALNRIKLKNLAETNKKAALAFRLLDMYDKVLSTVIIGNNVVNIAASGIATWFFVELFGAKGVSIATAAMTIIILLFADITPKVLAKESPEVTASRYARLLHFFIIIFTPLNYLILGWKKFIAKIFPSKDDRSVTEDELLTFVEEVMQEGGINKQEEHMIRQVIEFDDLTVSDIFTPRIDVAAISDGCRIEEIEILFEETGYSRLPVYKDTIDNITGIILYKDFQHEVMKGKKNLTQIIRQTVYVPGTMKISRLLQTMQKNQSHMAVVLDEHGGTLGIVTIEDMLEELVGEIWDEHDEVIEPVKMPADGIFYVLANIDFIEMLEAISAKIPDFTMPDEEQIPDTTVANWIMETLGSLPHQGEIISWQNLSIRVTKIFQHRVTEVKVIVSK